MIDTMDIKKGLYVKYKGDICTVVDFMHVKPGKGNSFTRTKFKRIKDGSVLENTFKSGEKIEDVFVEKQKMEYLYDDDTACVFMNVETFEQINVERELIGDQIKYFKENIEVMVKLYNGNPIDVELPNFITLKVTETAPSEKGNTVTGGTKPATMETGAIINVPMFVNEGEVLKIDTRTNEYVERVKN